MQIYILDDTYTIIGLIDEAESTLWHKKYNDLGESEIYIPCDETMIAMLQKGFYMFRYDDDMFCKIESVEIVTDIEQGNHLIATGTDIATLLSGRIVRWQKTFSGRVFDFIKTLLTDNVINPKLEDGTSHTVRKIPNLTFDDSNSKEFTETVEMTVNTEDLLQLIISTCKAYNYGFRISYSIENKTLKFRLYKGVNKASISVNEYVEFSPAFGNIISSSYKTDDRYYKNVVYVGYKSADEGDDKIYLLSVYEGQEEGLPEPQGEARREIYVDGTGTSRSITLDALTEIYGTLDKIGSAYYSNVGGELVAVAITEGTGEDEKITITDYTYMKLIRATGKNALAENTKVEEFSGNIDTIDTYAYKTDYNLGDVVKVVNDYGIGAPAQITEVIESEDAENGYSLEPRFNI